VACAHAATTAIPTNRWQPHLARKLLESRLDRQLRSSLDYSLQGFARESLRRHLGSLRQQNAEDGAVVVLDNASGEILAWIGSSGDLSSAAEVDGVTALRQAGSTLKPFLYALAFETRTLTPASLIEDAPLTLDTGNGLYAPQNYEPHYQGWVSVRRALGGSLNIPAVRTLVRLGPEPFLQRLRAAGFASLRRDGDWYGYSLALGSADISLLMLANAYRSLCQRQPLERRCGSHRAALCLRTKTRRAVPCRERDGCEERVRWTAPHAAVHGGRRELSDRRHPRRPQRARRHLRPRILARHALLGSGEDRHQQGHARQLVRRLLAPLHRGGVGRQRQRRAHARCLRDQPAPHPSGAR
jgi:membrane carboxypeptidase/penicillin-binding protein PbpC